VWHADCVCRACQIARSVSITGWRSHSAVVLCWYKKKNGTWLGRNPRQRNFTLAFFPLSCMHSALLSRPDEQSFKKQFNKTTAPRASFLFLRSDSGTTTSDNIYSVKEQLDKNFPIADQTVKRTTKMAMVWLLTLTTCVGKQRTARRGDRDWC
jgi:hypothetical protein